MPFIARPSAGQIIDPAWGTLVADAVVMRFTTAAQRTSLLTAPVAGQLTSLDSAPGVIWYWTGTAWAAQPTAWDNAYSTVPNLVIGANTTGFYDLPAVTVPFPGYAVLDITVAVFPNVAATLSQECQLGVVAGISGTPAPTAGGSYQKFSTHQTAAPSQLWVQGRVVAAWTALAAGAFAPRLQLPANLAGGPAINLQAVFGSLRVTAR